MRNPKGILLAWLVGLASLALLYPIVLRPLFLLVTEGGSTFHFTFNVVDLDLDGDPDVLVHGLRQAGEFEAYSGGAFWINQGGLQRGQAGQFVSRLNDIQGGRDSTTADLDGDGDPDVLVYEGFLLVVGLNQGGEQGNRTGVFRRLSAIVPPDGQPYGLVTQFGSLAVGDINNDGRIDALVLGCCGRPITAGPGDKIPHVSWVWFNQVDADGRLRLHENVAGLDALQGMPVAQAALGDLDGDADLDLFAVILKTPSGLGPGPTSLVLLNDGSGRFNDSGQRLSGKDGTSLALGDLDGDGDLDALVGYARGAAVWINQGGAQAGKPGEFAASDHAITGSRTRSVHLADLDSDGDLDALVVGKRRAELWWNDGQGDFMPARRSLPCSEKQDLTVGDFNADGRPDIFLAEYARNSQVWLNDGQGAFTSANR